MTVYRFHPLLFLRTPFYSFRDYTPDKLEHILGEETFRRALYFANPEFYGLVEAAGFKVDALKSKEIATLTNYYNRMSFRPTPFGCFSCFTLTHWSEDDVIRLAADDAVNIHLLPDQEISTRLAAMILDDKVNDTYVLNPTIYLLGKEYRFIKCFREDGKTRLSFSLETVAADKLITTFVKWMNRCDHSKEAIIAFVNSVTGCSNNEAADYFHFLRDAQLISSAFGPNIIGRDHLAKLMAEHTGDNDKPRFGWQLNAVKEPIEAFRRAESDLARIVPGMAHKPVYCNTERPLRAGGLATSYQDELLDVLECLKKLVPQGSPPMLEQFIKDFQSRYEGRKIPLLQALDPDAGAGYGKFAEAIADPSLLKVGVREKQTAGTDRIGWSPVHKLLFRKWHERKGHGPVELEPDDLSSLDTQGSFLPPPTMSVMFRPTKYGLLIESAGGISSNTLLGRFTPFSSEIRRLGREIAEMEILNNPGVIFAEIGQHSDTHVDNINRREQLYDFEIPVNSISLLPPDQQLPPNDLIVSVIGGQVILESASLQKRVIPRLSSAYNPRNNHLALFRFLYDIQYQGLRSDLNFDPENVFPGLDHYPRIIFRNTILSPAKWYLDDGDLGECRVPDEPSAKQVLENLRDRLKIPAMIAVTRADQQLVFNLDTNEGVTHFFTAIKQKGKYLVQEFFLPPTENGAVLAAGGQPLIAQFLSFLYHDKEVYNSAPVSPGSKIRKVEREFLPGSSWLYFKIYCTVPMANAILTEQIRDIIEKLKREYKITWFFIRYNDPGHHIRFRIKMGEENCGKVIRMMNARFSRLLQANLLREYQADTYRRELERYGPDMIIAAENFFQASSELVVAFLKDNRRRSRTEPMYLLAMHGINTLLTAWLDTSLQIEFLKELSEAFLAEFNADKKLKVELDMQYRDLKVAFASLNDKDRFFRERRLGGYQKRFRRSLDILCRSAGKFKKERKKALLSDFIHMHVNRVFSEEQRKQEMVLYYCFYKFKLSEAAREKRIALKFPFGLNK